MKKKRLVIVVCAALVAVGVVGIYFTHQVNVIYPLISGVLILVGILGVIYTFAIQSDDSEAEHEFRVMQEHVEDNNLLIEDFPVTPRKQRRILS